MKKWNAISVSLRLLLLATAPAMYAQTNPNCTLIVPNAPLTAQGLATTYQLTATDPNAGACHETNTDQAAFVQAAVVDPATGQISIYNPLVVDQGTTPAAAPVLPTLPKNAVVGLWFGFNGDTLTLQAASGVLDASCVNGVPNSNFGQFAYCNAPAIFRAANRAFASGQLQVPALGTASDGQPCPTVRDFFIVDQDQSDNLPTSYLVTTTGKLAQNTQANVAAFPGATVLGNPSDNGLLDKVVDKALGCTPMKAPDLADRGQSVAALPLNEIHARASQAPPGALVPAGDPMVLNNGSVDLDKLSAYRRGVGQPEVSSSWQADTARYCRNLFRIAPGRLLLNQGLFTATPSPIPEVANSLFTFLAQRFVSSYDILTCADLIHQPDPVTVTFDSLGVAIAATIKTGTKQQLATDQPQDAAADAAASAAPVH